MINDARNIDTTPGSNNVFSPKLGWEGDQLKYIELMRKRYNTFDYMQDIVFQINYLKRGYDYEITGPYRDQALDILQKLGANIDSLSRKN